jgi:SAM-dependent methyltransferase
MAGYNEGTRAHYRDPAYYDQAYRRRRDDVRFYEELAKEHSQGKRKAPRGAVLELGVGTGRVALGIARAGIALDGVDLMPEMLAALEKRLLREPADVRARVSLRTGDLRTVNLKRRYPLVIAPFNVLMHMYDRQDWERALKNVRRHLAPGGRFAFDVLLPELFFLSRPSHRKYSGGMVTLPEDGKRYRFLERYDYDAWAQVQTVYMEFVDGRGRVKRATPLSQRQLFPQELEALLHYNGFKIEQFWGDFRRKPLDNDSESQVIVARARK